MQTQPEIKISETLRNKIETEQAPSKSVMRCNYYVVSVYNKIEKVWKHLNYITTSHKFNKNVNEMMLNMFNHNHLEGNAKNLIFWSNNRDDYELHILNTNPKTNLKDVTALKKQLEVKYNTKITTKKTTIKRDTSKMTKRQRYYYLLVGDPNYEPNCINVDMTEIRRNITRRQLEIERIKNLKV